MRSHILRLRHQTLHANDKLQKCLHRPDQALGSCHKLKAAYRAMLISRRLAIRLLHPDNMRDSAHALVITQCKCRHRPEPLLLKKKQKTSKKSDVHKKSFSFSFCCCCTAASAPSLRAAAVHGVWS